MFVWLSITFSMFVLFLLIQVAYTSSAV